MLTNFSLKVLFDARQKFPDLLKVESREILSPEVSFSQSSEKIIFARPKNLEKTRIFGPFFYPKHAARGPNFYASPFLTCCSRVCSKSS